MNDEIELINFSLVEQNTYFTNLMEDLIAENNELQIIKEISYNLKDCEFLYRFFELPPYPEFLVRKLTYFRAELDKIFKLLINEASETIKISNVYEMINGYPIMLISKITGCDSELVLLTGELIRSLINTRKRYQYKLDDKIYLYTIGGCEIILDPIERDAILLYLGTKKKLYINILLRTCYELRNIDFNKPLTVQDIKYLSEGNWLYILFFIAHINNNLYC